MMTPILNDSERLGYRSLVQHLPRDVAYFWKLTRELAERKLINQNGHPIHCGDRWSGLVEGLAEDILTELGVTWEMYAGFRYIAGKRIFWNSIQGRYESDDWR